MAATAAMGAWAWTLPLHANEAANLRAAEAPPCADVCSPLLGVAIEGATYFPIDELAPLYSGALAQEVGAIEIARIAERITQHYRAHGYFLSRAYAADLRDGFARIIVVEGYVGEIVIEGAGADLIRPFFDARRPIIHLADLDSRLARARDVPGVRVNTRMEPDLDDPRRHRLILIADLTRAQGVLAFDNRGVGAAGPVQAYARASFNSALRGRDQLSFAVFATPAEPEELAMAEASYSYVFSDGGRMFASGGLTRMESGAAPTMSGENHVVSIAYERPLYRTRRRGLWLGVRMDGAHLESDWAGGAGYVDEVRAARMSLRGFLDTDGSASTLFAQASFGLDLLGASQSSLARRSRSDADSVFVKWDFTATRLQALSNGFSLYGAFAGQWSNEALLQSEEFSVGGFPFGRAYAFGEISGERALAGLGELRWDGPDLLEPLSLQAYAFIDAARVWNEGRLTSASLSSAGFGLRLGIEDRVGVTLELARPLEDAPREQGDRDWRRFLTLHAAY